MSDENKSDPPPGGNVPPAGDTAPPPADTAPPPADTAPPAPADTAPPPPADTAPPPAPPVPIVINGPPVVVTTPPVVLAAPPDPPPPAAVVITAALAVGDATPVVAPAESSGEGVRDLKGGDTDPYLNKTVKELIFQGDQFIIYLDESQEIQYRGDWKFPPGSDEILFEVSRLETLTRFQFAKKRRGFQRMNAEVVRLLHQATSTAGAVKALAKTTLEIEDAIVEDNRRSRIQWSVLCCCVIVILAFRLLHPSSSSSESAAPAVPAAAAVAAPAGGNNNNNAAAAVPAPPPAAPDKATDPAPPAPVTPQAKQASARVEPGDKKDVILAVNTNNEFALWFAMGALGALLFTLQRLKALPAHPFGDWAAFVDSFARIMAGGLGACLLVLAAKANLLLGVLASSSAGDAAFWGTAVIAALAGISERLVPDFVDRMDASQKQP